jgi:methyl-accepting chemotaxis protein
MSLAVTLANLKVRTKIAAGFGLLLVILTAVGGTTVTSIVVIGNDFDHFLESAHTMTVVEDIEVATLNLVRDADTFAYTGNAEAVAKAQEAAKEAKAKTDSALRLVKAPELRKKVEDIAARLGNYSKHFSHVVDLRKEEDKFLTEVLEPIGSKLRDDLNRMAVASAGAGNSNAQILSLAASEALMAARLYAQKALARHDEATTQKAEAAFGAFRQTLKGIGASASDPALKPLYDEVAALTDKYFDGLQHALKNAAEIDRLIHGEMANDGAAIYENAEAVKHSLEEEEKSISTDVHSVIGSAEFMSIALVIVGLALGVGFAWLIGNGIATPVVGMTGAMQRLAGGDKSAEIPGAERKDEIGDMAAAVQIFRDNMIKADQLAEEQRAEQERKEKRQKVIEGYIAQFDATVAAALKTLASASTELQATANAMSATAEETQRQSSAVAAASEEATSNVQTVASAAEELTSSITEINRQVSESTRIAGQAVKEASSTDAKVQRLAEAASKIGDVVALINDIAGQTNLLALNATIEAARAGEAGKGFAVVASEVKSLATQTAKATEEISTLISSIQGETQDSVESIKAIGKTIGDINHIASTIAAAVEQQGAATQEIARNVQQAAEGTSEVATNITGVSEAAAQTGAAASQVLSAAGELSQQSETLRSEVDTFLANIRAA